MSARKPDHGVAHEGDSGNPAILELMSAGPEALRPRLSAGLPLNKKTKLSTAHSVPERDAFTNRTNAQAPRGKRVIPGEVEPYFAPCSKPQTAR
jgi:hypothetical protein